MKKEKGKTNLDNSLHQFITCFYIFMCLTHIHVLLPIVCLKNFKNLKRNSSLWKHRISLQPFKGSAVADSLLVEIETV
jgi:hypothetical protein